MRRMDATTMQQQKQQQRLYLAIYTPHRLRRPRVVCAGKHSVDGRCDNPDGCGWRRMAMTMKRRERRRRRRRKRERGEAVAWRVKYGLDC